MSTEASRESPHAPEGTAEFAMKIFMASWTLSFVALIGAYVYMRASSSVWPPDGLSSPPLGLTAVSTVAAFLSSVVLQLGVHRMNRGDSSKLRPALGFAAALGILFLLMQALVGVQSAKIGLLPTSGAYGALFWITACFHAVHVLVGVIALFALFAKTVSGSISKDRTLTVRLWSYYWHGVDAAWLAIFFVMFLPG